MTKRRIKKIIFWTLGVLSIPLLLGFAYGFYLTHTTEPSPTYELHSNLPYHEVDIPFTLRYGGIFVPVEVSGRKFESMLDTGSFDMTWNKSLHLPGKRTGRTMSLIDAGNNRIEDAEQIVLRSVYLGNYEVRGLSTYAVDTIANPKSMIGPMIGKTPLLANEVFCGGVLTIDYYQKEIIVRDRSYDFTKNSGAVDRIILPLHRRAASAGSSFWKPVVLGKINGSPAQIALDTGWSGRTCLNEAFGLQALPPSTKGVRKNTDEYGNLSYSYPAVPMRFERAANPVSPKTVRPFAKFMDKVPTQIYPDVEQQCDAIVGYDLLRFFRVTIDYPRQKLLLEPYGDDKVKILPKGALLTIGDAGQRPKRFRFDTDMVIFHYADKTTTVMPL